MTKHSPDDGGPNVGRVYSGFIKVDIFTKDSHSAMSEHVEILQSSQVDIDYRFCHQPRSRSE